MYPLQVSCTKCQPLRTDLELAFTSGPSSLLQGSLKCHPQRRGGLSDVIREQNECNEFRYLRHLIAAYTQWQIDNQQKQSGNNVCVWGKNLGGIKGTLECSCLHCLQYSKEIPARLSQNITTLPSFRIWHSLQHCQCSCSWEVSLLHLLWVPALLYWVHHLLGMFLRKHWQMDHAHQDCAIFPTPSLSATGYIAFHLRNHYLLRSFQHQSQGMLKSNYFSNGLVPDATFSSVGCETTPSCALSEIHRAWGPFSVPGGQAKA